MTKSQPDVETNPRVRLQKVLAECGAGSRRACEQLIAAGRVTVNGQVADVLGTRVDPAHDVVALDGQRLVRPAGKVYLALNKPAGVVTAMSDPQGRRCVGDLVGDRPERLFHVGRLDADTEGLLLLTNDGELAHRLTHPAHGVPKTYLAEVNGRVTKALTQQVLAGVEIDGRMLTVDAVDVPYRTSDRAAVEVTIHEGRNRIVRRLFDQLGHPVTRLVRLAVGPVVLGRLRPGELRELSPVELGDLFDLVSM